MTAEQKIQLFLDTFPKNGWRKSTIRLETVEPCLVKNSVKGRIKIEKEEIQLLELLEAENAAQYFPSMGNSFFSTIGDKLIYVFDDDEGGKDTFAIPKPLIFQK